MGKVLTAEAATGNPRGPVGGRLNEEQASWGKMVLLEPGFLPQRWQQQQPSPVSEGTVSPTLLANCQLPREARDSPVPHSASADRDSEGDRGPQVGPPPELFSSASRPAAILVDFHGRATRVRSAFF